MGFGIFHNKKCPSAWLLSFLLLNRWMQSCDTWHLGLGSSWRRFSLVPSENTITSKFIWTWIFCTKVRIKCISKGTASPKKTFFSFYCLLHLLYMDVLWEIFSNPCCFISLSLIRCLRMKPSFFNCIGSSDGSGSKNFDPGSDWVNFLLLGSCWVGSAIFGLGLENFP